MRLRLSGDDEWKKYDLDNIGNFDSGLLEKRLKRGHHEAYERREQRRDERQMRRNQRVLNKCGLCFYNERAFEGKDMVVAESENVYVSFPIKNSPLVPG